jgi:hypothetical protein
MVCLPRLLGLLLAAAVLAAASPAARAQERPLYYDRALTDAELQGRTLRELTLMRNTIYARAGHTFVKKWLADYFTAQPWYHPLPKDDDSKITAVDRANAKAISLVEQNQSRGDLEKRREDVLARQRAGKATPADDVELRLLNTRLGQWVPAAEAAAPPADVSPLEDPTQLDKLLTVNQLDNMSRRDLRLLRNTVYARHGWRFKSPLLQEYFGAMEWYKEDPTFTEKGLSKIDTANIKLIKSVEATRGGPMTDDEQRGGDEAWMSKA